MSDKSNQNGWNEWSRHVLAEMQRQNGAVENLEEKLEIVKDDLLKRIDTVKDDFTKSFNEEIRKIQVDIAMLQVKSGVWGLVGGLIPILIYVVLEVVKK